MGKIFHVQHHHARVEHTEIATAHRLVFTCDIFNHAVDAKTFFKQLHKLFRKPVFQIPKHAV